LADRQKHSGKMKLHEKLRPHTHIAQIKAKAYAESKTIPIEPIKRQLYGNFNNIDSNKESEHL